MSFAAALYGTAGSLRSSCKPGKSESFGFQFTGVIVLDNASLKPYSKITGQLALDLGWPITQYGIRVQLEARCTLTYETKLDNRVSFHKKYDNILEGSGESEMYDTYQTSPVTTNILPQVQDELPAGNHRYRFTLNMTGEALPAPFKTSYGTLKYKIVAYMRSQCHWVQVAEKAVRFSGYHNLSQNPDVLKPIEIERFLKKSIFSNKKMVTATLKLDSCGYLPMDELPFTLCINNPKCQPLQMWVSLNQRCVYNVDGAKKTTVAVLDSCVNEVTEADTEYAWTGTLNIHKGAAPSYCIHPMYTVSHILQFRVKVDDYNIVKGDVPIFIGSTREAVELLIISANSLSVVDDRFPRRRNYAASTHSDCSGLTQFTLPPAYSLLSSRVPSFETLPPPYDEFVHRGQRRRSCVEFRVIPPEATSENSSPQAGDITPASTPVTDD